MVLLTKRKMKLIATIEIVKQLKQIKKDEDKKKVIRKCWVKPLLMKRSEHDLEAHLLKDLVWEQDENDFRNFTRLNIVQFEEVLSLVYNNLKKTDTVMRNSIMPRIKLCVTLRYLATGDSYKSLEFLSRISRSTIGAFIPIVLKEIYDSLRKEHLKVPNTETEWMQISNDFNSLWQFPHTLGALDGKHIRIKAPPHTGSQFFNFKGFHSIVLFACVDAHTRFVYINVGCNGKASDNTIYQDCFLNESLHNGTLNVPQKTKLVPGEGPEIDYFFVGDDAFGLDRHLMKPYSRATRLSTQQEIFNYRMCRARMVVECAFGRLANRFRIFHRPIDVLPETVDLIVMASCVLHNMLTKPKTTISETQTETENLPETFSSIGIQNHKTYKYASRVRDELSRYFVNEGQIVSQWQKINVLNN